MIRISSFQWDKNNLYHLLHRHEVTRKEAEEVFIGDPYFRRGRDKTHYIYGQTDAGRYLFVVYLYLGNGKARIVSARDMTKKEKNLYLRR